MWSPWGSHNIGALNGASEHAKAVAFFSLRAAYETCGKGVGLKPRVVFGRGACLIERGRGWNVQR